MEDPIILKIPRLNDQPNDFDYLFSLWEKVKGQHLEVYTDFQDCDFIRPNGVAFLGGLWRWIDFNGGKRSSSQITNQAVLTNLNQNGFLEAFSPLFSSWRGNSIPYREDKALDADKIMDYLTDDWLGRGWVQVSSELRDAIAGHVFEIYANAFEHAESPIGVFTCGQHFPQQNELILSVVDFGYGIAANVRHFLRNDERANQLSTAACLKWAFQSGTTTQPNGIARGIGLDLLKDFIRINHGKLEVYSNNGYVLIDANNEKYITRSTGFDGAIFHITLRCDEQFYALA